MEYVDRVLSNSELKILQNRYGDYVKITLDTQKEVLIVGCELHADGEAVLLKKGSKQSDIWGGGINFQTKEVDTTAVLNLRPRLNNNSLEILDQERREKFLAVVKKLFIVLWET